MGWRGGLRGIKEQIHEIRKGDGEGWRTGRSQMGFRSIYCTHIYVYKQGVSSQALKMKKGKGDFKDMHSHVAVHTSSPRRGLTVALNCAVPNTLDRAILSEYSVPACSSMM